MDFLPEMSGTCLQASFIIPGSGVDSFQCHGFSMHLDLLSQDVFLQDLNCWATMANMITIIIIIIAILLDLYY